MIDFIKKHPWFHILFAVVIIAEMVGLTVHPPVRLVSKGMIMGSLIGFYILSVKKQNNALLMGMVMALLGDAFLLFTTQDFFLIGLGCFLMMQLLYTFTFWSKRRIPKTKDKLIAASIYLIPLGFYLLAGEKLGGMKWPVVLYAVAIATMLAAAYLRHPKLVGYTTVLIGSVFFVISDLILAINKFLEPIPNGGILVMVTYIIAQYLIISGIVREGEYRVEQLKAKKKSLGRFKMK